MPEQSSRKQENHSHVRLLRIVRTPDEEMMREMKRGVYALRVGEGQVRPRRFYKICEDELFPASTLSKLTDDAVGARVDEASFVEAIVSPIVTMMRTKFRLHRKRAGLQHDTGEFDPPTPAQIKAAA